MLRLRLVLQALLLVAIFFTLRRLAYEVCKGYQAWPAIIIMWPTFVTFGIGFVLFGLSRARQAGAIEAALTGHAVPAARRIPVDGERVRVVGTLYAFGDALRAPFSGTDSVFYSYVAGQYGDAGAQLEQIFRQGNTSGLVGDYRGYGYVPCYVRTSMGDLRLLRYPNYLTGFPGFQSTSIILGDQWTQFLSETQFAEDHGLPGMASEFNDVTRVDVKAAGQTNPSSYMVGESAVPAGTLVIAKGRYSRSKNGLTGTISLTAVNETMVRQLRNTVKGSIGLSIFLVVVATGFAALLIFMP